MRESERCANQRLVDATSDRRLVTMPMTKHREHIYVSIYSHL
jgi:hypothetical protein